MLGYIYIYILGYIYIWYIYIYIYIYIYEKIKDLEYLKFNETLSIIDRNLLLLENTSDNRKKQKLILLKWLCRKLFFMLIVCVDTNSNFRRVEKIYKPKDSSSKTPGEITKSSLMYLSFYLW